MRRRMIGEFQGVTGATKRVAERVLSRHRYDLEAAINYYFSNPGMFPKPKVKKGNEAKLGEIFTKFADDDDPNQLSEKLAEFAEFINVDAEGLGLFVAAWKLKASNFCIIEKKEFVSGFSSAGVDTQEGIQKLIKNSMSEIKGNSQQFAEFYRWSFGYMKDDEKRKIMDLEVAVQSWPVFLKSRFGLTDEWLEYLQARDKVKVTQDLWNQILDFSNEVNDDLEKYNEEEAWHSYIDEFVNWLRKKRSATSS